MSTSEPLTFKGLREANALRHYSPDWHPACKTWIPAQWLQAVVGELGEYANLRKKLERGDISILTFEFEAAKELADVVTYIDLLAMQLNIDLGKAVRDKFNEVSQRGDVSSDVRL